jgi:hypothetical protein
MIRKITQLEAKVNRHGNMTPAAMKIVHSYTYRCLMGEVTPREMISRCASGDFVDTTTSSDRPSLVDSQPLSAVAHRFHDSSEDDDFMPIRTKSGRKRSRPLRSSTSQQCTFVRAAELSKCVW